MSMQIWDNNLTYFLLKKNDDQKDVMMIEMEQCSINDESEMITKETIMNKNVNLRWFIMSKNC